MLLECGYLYLVGIPIIKLNTWIFNSTIIALHYTVTLLYIDPSSGTALRLLKSVQLNHPAQVLSLSHVGCVTTLVKYVCIRTAHMMQTSYNKKETHLLQLLSLKNCLATSVYICQWPGSQTGRYNSTFNILSYRSHKCRHFIIWTTLVSSVNIKIKRKPHIFLDLPFLVFIGTPW